MSTRGFVSFVIDGDEKTAYNHSDSYPAGLGVAVLSWLRVAMEDEPRLRAQAQALRVVDPNTDPAGDDIEKLSGYLNPYVDGRRERPSWYQLLRHTQGNPKNMLAAGAIEDASAFPCDSLFAEYGYVVDLDANVFEAYKGFQKKPHDRGRFAGRPGQDEYFPVALVASWPLPSLPSDEEFLAAVDPNEDEES